MIYTINNIADFCNVDYGFINRIIDSNELRPKIICGNANEKKGYSFYQLFIIQAFLEQLSQKNLYFDFENEEISIIYESKINNYELPII
jgi:hypothetical protein